MNIIIITKGEVKTTCNQHQPESIHRYCPGQKYFPFLEIFDIITLMCLSCYPMLILANIILNFFVKVKNKDDDEDL